MRPSIRLVPTSAPFEDHAKGEKAAVVSVDQVGADVGTSRTDGGSER